MRITKDDEIHFKLYILYFHVIEAHWQYFVHCLVSHTPLPTFVSVKVNLYGGVSTRIEDLSGVNLDDRHAVGAREETEKLSLLLSGQTCTAAGLRQKNNAHKSSTLSKSLFSRTTGTPLLLPFLLWAYTQKYPDLAASLGMLTGMLLS